MAGDYTTLDNVKQVMQSALDAGFTTWQDGGQNDALLLRYIHACSDAFSIETGQDWSEHIGQQVFSAPGKTVIVDNQGYAHIRMFGPTINSISLLEVQLRGDSSWQAIPNPVYRSESRTDGSRIYIDSPTFRDDPLHRYSTRRNLMLRVTGDMGYPNATITLLPFNGIGTISSSGATVTGVGTGFTGQVKVGDTIFAGGQSVVVANITNNSTLTTTVAFSPVISAGSMYSIGGRSATYVAVPPDVETTVAAMVMWTYNIFLHNPAGVLVSKTYGNTVIPAQWPPVILEAIKRYKVGSAMV